MPLSAYSEWGLSDAVVSEAVRFTWGSISSVFVVHCVGEEFSLSASVVRAYSDRRASVEVVCDDVSVWR